MSERAIPNAAEDLLLVLAEERGALRAGALDRIATVGARKQALLHALQGQALPSETLERIRQEALRNAALLAAAARGVQSVLARLRDLQSAGGGDTYGPDGRLRRAPRTGLSRRF
jgi:flagellar biosynthesis/type III secretory pathway chaperone